MSKTAKYGLIIGLILIAILAVWYFMGGKKWTTYANKGGGAGALMEVDNNITVAAAKTKAEAKGYGGFFHDLGTTAWFFDTIDVTALTPNTGGSVYVFK